uniref:Uncharacterized protein n=1 Tax=Anguilla anguilla TaxID=7936 RepID=A0A0E9XZQ1_ANGAN
MRRNRETISLQGRHLLEGPDSQGKCFTGTSSRGSYSLRNHQCDFPLSLQLLDCCS